MKLTMNNGFGTTYKFETTDRIPAGYVVWNIGENMIPGYLPVAMMKPGTYEIRTETLKAIALPEDELSTLRKVASRGLTSKKAAGRAVKRGSRSVSANITEKAYAIYDRISD